MGHGHVVLFATHIDVTALAQDENCECSKDDETYKNLPHDGDPVTKEV
jgi:hypothetical protein